MNKIEEYTPATNKYELYTHLSEQIISGSIDSFSKLLDYASKINFDKIVDGKKILENLFTLIRTMHWGFFKHLTSESYPKVWKEMILANKKYPFAGDLKLSLSLADIYIAMLDIHGYTKFCEENKNNLSKIHLLDDLIQNKIPAIGKHYNALSRRERGDEIVMVCTSASDALSATVAIIAALGKKTILKQCPQIETTGLPEFKISAGIAGGNSNTPLIVTESGELSGYLLNNAARMQTRANMISANESKIISTKNLQFNFIKENSGQNQSELFKNKIISFYDNGNISFKGTEIPIVEAIFKEEEKYKENFYPEMEELIKSVKNNLWKQRLFTSILSLIARVCQSMPNFQINERVNDYLSSYNNTVICDLCSKAEVTYTVQDNYKGAIESFALIIELLKTVPNFDKMTLEYAENILHGYEQIMPKYDTLIHREIESNLKDIFPIDHVPLFLNVKKASATYDKLMKHAEQSKALQRRKYIWYGILEKELSNLVISMYSGKK